MPQPTHPRRKQGISLLEVTISMGILAYGLLGIAAMQLQAMSVGAKGRQFRQAVEIAKDQMELVQILPWDQLAPTGGFAPPSWIDLSGFTPGELPVRVDLPGEPGGSIEQVYMVGWQVADANADATLRDIDIRVQWTEPPARARSYTISSLRSK